MSRPGFALMWSAPAGVLADLLRVAALISAAVVFALGRLEGGLRFVGIFALLVGLRRLAIPRPFDAAFGVMMLVAGWANAARWYQLGWWVDVAIHFFLPATTAAMLYLVLARLDLLPDLHDSTLRRHRASVVVLTLVFGLAIGALWELYEWLAVTLLPSTTINVGYDDTILDLAMDGLGSLTAGFLLAWWASSGLGTRRRAPAHPRGRDPES